MKKVFYAVSSFLVGLSLCCGSDAQAQAPYRDFTLTPSTVASLCRGRFENPVDIIINETNGGIGTYLLAGNQLLGLTLQAYPVGHMGGTEAVRSHLRQMESEASGDPLRVASPLPLGDEGVMLIQYDREGAEVTRSLSFLQGNLLIAVTGITSDEVAACSGGGLNSLAEHIARGLRFSGPDTAPPTPAPGQNIEELLARAQRVSPDRCLVDTWSLTDIPLNNNPLARQAAVLLSTDEVAVEPLEPALSGTQLLTFEPDGSVWMESNLMTIRLSGVVHGRNASTVEITQESSLDGAAAGMASFYRRGSESLLWIILDSNEVHQTIVMSYDGMIDGQRLRDRQTTYSGTPQTNLSDGVVSYTCQNDTLALTLTPDLPDAPPLTWRYTRL